MPMHGQQPDRKAGERCLLHQPGISFCSWREQATHDGKYDGTCFSNERRPELRVRNTFRSEKGGAFEAIDRSFQAFEGQPHGWQPKRAWVHAVGCDERWPAAKFEVFDSGFAAKGLKGTREHE